MDDVSLLAPQSADNRSRPPAQPANIPGSTMTPNALMALLEDNVRCHEQILHTCEASAARAHHSEMSLQQDIISSLCDRFALSASDQLHLVDKVRKTLSKRSRLESQFREEMTQASQSAERILAELREQQNERESLNRPLLLGFLNHPDFVHWDEQRATLLKEHERLMAIQPELTSECAEKLAAYQKDECYRFLCSVNYGTDHYSRFRIFHGLDNWLARKVNYRENRRNQLLLLEMPRHLEQALSDLTDKVAAINTQVDGLWKALWAAADVTRSSDNVWSLAGNYLDARKRMTVSWFELEEITRCNDKDAANVRRWLKDQLGVELEGFLEQYKAQASIDNATFVAQHKDELRAVKAQSHERFMDVVEAANNLARARDLQGDLLTVRREENPCIEGCDCMCHQQPSYKGLCNCVFFDERYYDYPAHLDFPQLVASYMSKDLTLADLGQLFRNERRYFRDTPRLAKHAHDSAHLPR